MAKERREDKPSNSCIYTRISDDSDDLRAGVQRQEKDGRALAEKLDWQLLPEPIYEDNDTSAWSGKPRQRFREMLRDIEDGKIDGVIIWHLDRLARSVRDLEDFIDVCTKMGTKVATVTGELDIGTSDGLVMARIMVAIARKSSDDSSRRIRRKMEDNAAEGKPSGGGKPAYGFERDGRDPDTGESKPGFVGRHVKAEADIIRSAADRVEAGEGLLGIVRDFNDRGIATATGGKWSTRTLKRILLAPRTAGRREHKGEIVGEAKWKPIIKPEQQDRLRSLLTDPSRHNGGTTARKYLLVGFCFCASCEARLVSRSRGKTGSRSYQCSSAPPYIGCGKLSVIAGPLEEMVRDALFNVLDGPGLAKAVKAMGGEDEAHASILDALRQDEATLEELARDHYVDRTISKSEFLAARGAIEGRIKAAQRELSRSAKAGVLASVPRDGGALAKAWDVRGLDWKRSVLSVVLDRVVIAPAPVRGRRAFDPRRVEFVWNA